MYAYSYHLGLRHVHVRVRVRVRTSGGSAAANALNSFKPAPKSTSGRFKRTDRIAWVAQALLITCA